MAVRECGMWKEFYLSMEKSSVSKLAASSFTSQFFSPPPAEGDSEKCLTAIKNNRPQILHSFAPSSGLGSLLLTAAFHNSPVCALYLLARGASETQLDSSGRSVLHVCAYTGHVEVMRTVRNHTKLNRIRTLNTKYVKILQESNYKRTDAKQGKLKTAVSDNRQRVFERLQGAVGDLYEQYVMSLIEDTLRQLATPVKDTQRNCLHLACLNRYQKCYGALEYILEELGDWQLHIDQNVMQLYTEVNNCFDEPQRVDPRLLQDALLHMEELILPSRLAHIRKEANRKTSEAIAALLESKDGEGLTPLHVASRNGYTAMIGTLQKWGAKAKGAGERQELVKLAGHGLARSHIMDLCDASRQSDPKAINFLLSCGEEINRKKTIFGTFALLEAVRSFEVERNLQPIRLLLLSGADPNEQDTNGWTVMHHACERGLTPILEQMFKIWEQGKCAKLQLNRLTNKSYHMLHLASLHNHPETIHFLLNSPTAKKLELNRSSIDGENCTMLHHAARRGSLECIRKIFQLEPSLIYQVDVRSNTALHYAAMSDHASCIRELLFFDSDFDKLQGMQNSRGKLARDLTVNKKPFENAFTAVRKGDVNTVRRLLSETPALRKTVTPQKQRNLLILAVMNQHLLVVKLLVEQGSDLSHKDKSGKSARDYAKQQEKAASNRQQAVTCKNLLALLPQ